MPTKNFRKLALIIGNDMEWKNHNLYCAFVTNITVYNHPPPGIRDGIAWKTLLINISYLVFIVIPSEITSRRHIINRTTTCSTSEFPSKGDNAFNIRLCKENIAQYAFLPIFVRHDETLQSLHKCHNNIIQYKKWRAN